MISRRGLLEAAGGALALTGAGAVPAWSGGAGEQPGETLLSPLPAGTRAEALLDTLPGKKPLIKLTYRPPNYEAPLAYLRTAITPNDEFFVRYHLADIPQIDAGTWKLSLGGEGANGDLQIGLDELKKLPAFEIAAVCQCAGNRRGLFQPHVAGVQWGSGAMGCARWKGARLKDMLDLVGLKKEAVEIVFDGADGPVLDKTPDFAKSLPVWKVIEETTLVAYEMNGEPLPHWNGFPARIVVPGWTATYWVKHITSITAVTKPFDGFWMKTAYRIPVGKFPLVARFISQETAANTPITEMVVNSLITIPNDGARVKAGSKTAISGIVWDGGYGIRSVEISADNGKSWAQAVLGEDSGKFAFRPWSHEFTPERRGKLALTARATNKIGQTQTQELIQNPAGYCNNAAQTVALDVS
ncbi:MAG: molybdopterin-dependent oxidoreductase [Pseudomonadota bacterium]|nr:molybdopterin-dependent oxidoreductase [Pseudomonadota bacterium]